MDQGSHHLGHGLVSSFHYVSATVAGVQLASERFPVLPGASTLPAYNGLLILEMSYGRGGLSLLWFEPLVAVLSILLASLSLERPTQAKRPTTWWILIASPLLSLVVILFRYAQDSRGLITMPNFSPAWGFRVFLLGMGLVVLGGVLLRFLHRERRVLTG